MPTEGHTIARWTSCSGKSTLLLVGPCGHPWMGRRATAKGNVRVGSRFCATVGWTGCRSQSQKQTGVRGAPRSLELCVLGKLAMAEDQEEVLSGRWRGAQAQGCRQHAQSSKCLKRGLTSVSQELGGNVQLVAGSGHGGAAGATQKGVVGRTAWSSAAVQRGELPAGQGFQADHPVLEEQFWWWYLSPASGSHGGL